MKIETIEIGKYAAPLVIPEIGINHGGDLKAAKEMVLAAHRAGARLIKHQTHVIDDEMSVAAKTVIPGNADISIYDIMKQNSLLEEEERELMEYTQSLGMIFLSTPFSRAAADRLARFGVAAFKIGSGELNNYPLLNHIASLKKPMILSTGMNNMESVKKAVDILEMNQIDYALMHTTNLYPTVPKQVRLGAMQELMREFPEIPVGLSDHTQNNNACIAALALGASLVERHFTDHKRRKGPDIICSMDEIELAELVKAANEVPLMLGGRKEALEEENVTIKFAFASVVTTKPIQAGELFTEENLWVKRPGTGEIPAKYYSEVLGKKAACDISGDIHLKKNMIVWSK